MDKIVRERQAREYLDALAVSTRPVRLDTVDDILSSDEDASTSSLDEVDAMVGAGVGLATEARPSSLSAAAAYAREQRRARIETGIQGAFQDRIRQTRRSMMMQDQYVTHELIRPAISVGTSV
jgi:hypothetical protein